MKKLFRGSLGTTLLFWFLLISIIPIAIVTSISYGVTVKSLNESAIADLRKSSDIKAKFINNWFHFRKLDISSWAQTSSTLKFMESLNTSYISDTKSLKDHMQSYKYIENITSKEEDLVRIQREYSYIYDIFLIDVKGNILYTIVKEDDLGTNLLTGIYNQTKFAATFRQTMSDGALHYSDLEFYGPSNNVVANFLTTPIVNEWGNVIGVLAVQLKIDTILSIFDDADKTSDYHHYLVGEDALLRTILDEEHQVLKYKVDSEQFALWNEEHGASPSQKTNQKETILSYKGPLDYEVLGLHQDIDILGVKWALISEVSQKSVIADADEMIVTIVQFAFVLMLFIVLISYYVSRRIALPLKELANASIDLSNGEVDIYIQNNATGEIGELTHSFNYMLESIKIKDKSIAEQKFALDAHSIVAITDAKGTIEFVNEKFVEISGYTQKELIGSNHRILNSGLYSKEFWTNMYAVVQSGKVWNAEVRNIDKNGVYYWVDTTIVPFLENGKAVRYIAIRTDITQKKKNEEDLIQAKEYAEETAKTKAEFLASMSHEIRTPMNGVIGMLGLLSNSKLDEAQAHQAHLATSSANALLTLINDILDFSKIEAGKLELEEIDFDLRKDLGDFAEAISFGAQEKDVEVVLDVKGVGFNRVKSDPGRIRQILTNLVGNAVKFTQVGTILIKAELNTKDENDVRLIISVQDSGIGIPEDKIDSLFDTFSQVDASTTRKYGGTGLGLAIAKTLCELMNGSIKVQSELGKGSTFTLDIGVTLGENTSTVMPRVDIKGKRILIVDDNEINLEVLRGQLEYWDMDVYAASSASEALKMCEKNSEKGLSPAYDIAFLDMQMPNMDGADLGKILRSDSKYDTMKLVMMTSLGFRTDAKEFGDIGFDAFFPKPATTDDIFHALHVLVDDAKALRNADPLVTSDYLRSLKKEEENLSFRSDTRILLVEDNKTNQFVALGLLDNFDLDADVANHGLEAVTILKDSKEPYDIILMDCQMPEMDGYETTKEIRKSNAGSMHKGTAIIAMTANAMQGDREKCLAAGMDDYLAKPINAKGFEGILRKWLLGKEISTPNLEKETTPELKIWDKEDALARLGGSEDILRKIVAVFIDDVVQEVEKLELAMHATNYEDMKLHAHTIKGAAGNVGATKLQALAKTIEFAAKDSLPMDTIKSQYQTLSLCLKETVLLLEKIQENENDVKKVEMSSEQIKLDLEQLLRDVQNGEFIESENLDVFKADVSQSMRKSLGDLKKEIDAFESDKAIQSIEKIFVDLDLK